MATKKKETITPKPEPVKKLILAITLGSSLKAGDEITPETYLDLQGAGFTDEQLFGKQ